MKINPLYLFLPMIEALDIEEHDLVGSTAGHGARTAYLAYTMAKNLNWSRNQLLDFSLSALLHDCGSVETIRNMRDAAKRGVPFTASFSNGTIVTDASIHAQLGENIIRNLPFYSSVKGVIQMHHEHADGSGPMGLTEGMIDERAQILYLADRMDIWYDLLSLSEEGFHQMMADFRKKIHHEFTGMAIELMNRSLTYTHMQAIQHCPINSLLKEILPQRLDEYTMDDMLALTTFFERIVDNKSSFTKVHSHGIAMKALRLSAYYKWEEEKRERFLLAASLHDYGKLRIDSAILEKAGPLTDEEFQTMKTHVRWTYEVLNDIPGFEDIRDWASFHHEKLDGSGYFKGLKGEALSFESRLMACIDIYQALTEKRPYKVGYSHDKSIHIMEEMAKDGKIDGSIVNDMNQFFWTQRTGNTRLYGSKMT